ncbi:MAG: serine/threonine protein kinase [Acidobacteriota bacterium]|nr:serine/threonine protein kinase [Acidobacteriota bacterium]
MLKEGLEIKDYTLKKFLGKGGFGEVWLAEKKIEIADKKVPFALKFISDSRHEISDYSTVKREINTWIDASGNKNIISVQDGFIYENLFVIVSEYANNGSMRQWLREHGGKSPGLEKTVEIMSGILDGLTHLHSQNIIHRDLKPENVLLKGDVPCIADFGVSRIVDTASLEISQAGTGTAGSPLYMSPESFERIKPAPQIDIWSAGVMLFEMLSGKTPYSADTIPSLIYEIVTKEPRSLPADIPESFHKVVKKALAKDISDRFSSAKEMREALMRALYSQHHSPSDSAETRVFAELNENHLANEASGIDMLKTLPLSKEIPVAEIGQNNDKGNKKMLAWIGLGAGAVLAGSIGIFTLTQSSADGNSNQKNNLISNQAATSETNVSNNSNASSYEMIAKPQNVEKTIEKPAEKQTEKINVEKEKTQPNQRTTATKTESAPKKDAPKQTRQTKKKVTLDDLINNN